MTPPVMAGFYPRGLRVERNRNETFPKWRRGPRIPMQRDAASAGVEVNPPSRRPPPWRPTSPAPERRYDPRHAPPHVQFAEADAGAGGPMTRPPDARWDRTDRDMIHRKLGRPN